MEIIIFVLYLFGLCMLIFRGKFFTVEGIKKPLLVSLWGVKLLVGVCFYVLFICSSSHKETCNSKVFFESSEKFYWMHSRESDIFWDFVIGKEAKSDSVKYQIEAKEIQWNMQSENPLINDNHTVMRVNMVLYSFCRFHSVHLLFMCFFSFVGSILLFKAFPKQGRKQIYASTIACFLVPSLIFWSAGVLKEPLLLLGLGGFLFYFRKITDRFSFSALLWLVLSILLLVSVKVYVFVLLLPLLLVFFCCQKHRRFALLKYTAVTVVLGILGWFYATPFVKNIPLAIYNCLTQPFVRPMNDFASLCMNLETLLIILLLVVCLPFGNYKRFFRNNFAIFSIFVCLYGFILTGMTPHDAGMMMRDKAIFLPFYVYGLVYLLDTNKVMRFFRIRKLRKKKNFDIVEGFEERMKNMKRW